MQKIQDEEATKKRELERVIQESIRAEQERKSGELIEHEQMQKALRMSTEMAQGKVSGIRWFFFV